ncbi:MAG: tetratricopeptide repeat protein [Planctomycetota bacterium]
MRPLVVLILVLLCGSTELMAMAVQPKIDGDPVESALARRRERASEYLIDRAGFRSEGRATEAYEAAAQAALGVARGALEARDYDEAYDLSWDAYKDYIYSTAADRLLHVFILAATHLEEITKAANALIDLWYRFPEHQGLDELLRFTLDTAEALQNPTGAINWEADEPTEVIDEDAVVQLYAADTFFRFLAEHGDYHDVAPRATLGLARSILIRGYDDKRRLAQARLAYLDLLQRYPESGLVFQALCEQALCYLLGFRGDRFDGGVLETASLIVDQAELYTADEPGRRALIARFRDLITRWNQMKDFQVARWYDRHGPERSALYYYRQSLAYDTSTDVARQAARAIDRLEQVVGPLPDELPAPPASNP